MVVRASQKADPERNSRKSITMERLRRMYWRAIDPLAYAVELARCRLVDWTCGDFPETEVDKAIRERGDRRITSDPRS
jgi:hypothetical protein